MEKNLPKPLPEFKPTKADSLDRGHFCQLLTTIPRSKGCDFDCDLSEGVVINLAVASLPIIKKVLEIYQDNHHHVLIEQRGVAFIKKRIAEESASADKKLQ